MALDVTNVNQVVDKVAGLLSQVADKIGVAADKVWPWLVKQQILEGISLGFIALVGLVGTFFTVKGMLKWWSTSWRRKENEDWDANEDRETKVYTYRTVYTASACLFALILLVAGSRFISLGWLQIFNPEYYALMDLLHAVKP